MSWRAQLKLDLRMEAGRCVARFEHDGPLRILQTLYPEGDAISHNVLVHPPSGLVGGDTLAVDIQAGPGAHGLVTTPGASRFYRSEGEAAVQRTSLSLADGARLEWMPLEAICYSGCNAENRVTMELAPTAELLGWDIAALGLPAAQLPFEMGTLRQHIELRGAWLERGTISAGDEGLLNGPLGLAGQRCLATLFFVSGSDMPKARRELALELARERIASHPLSAFAGATSPNPRVVVVRALAPLVEPAIALLKSIRAAWRPALWGLAATVPRTWAL
ncbi:urease accessory protein UreD [Caenimonas koreensis]|uniref:urease accessory protein UreD n=1 Tax=Caenimonas koreensis TaxID=367474 RepID=UPI003783FEA3